MCQIFLLGNELLIEICDVEKKIIIINVVFYDYKKIFFALSKNKKFFFKEVYG